MKKIIEGRLYYSRTYLFTKVGLSQKALKHWHERKTVSYVKAEGETWYCYDEIPLPSREKIIEREDIELVDYLAYGYYEDYARFMPAVGDAGVKQPNKRKAKAREWAVWERLERITSEENPNRVTIARAFYLYKEKLRMPKGLTHYHSFYKKLCEFRRNPAAALIDAKTGRKSNRSKKTERHVQILEALHALPNKYKGPTISEMANELFRREGLPGLAYETIKKILADPALQARTYLSRHGAKAHSDEHEGYIRFERPQAIGVRAEMDGVKLPFKVWNPERTKLVRPVMFAVIDTYSGKITGWALDYTETRWLVLQSFKSQAQSGWFPSELWADNFSAKDTPEFTDIRAKVEARGTKIKYARVGKGQDKPFIERFFRTLQDRFCREYGDWVGMGVRSKSRDDRANPEAYKAYVKKHGYPTLEQVRERVADMLEKYHNTSFKNEPTANERFAACHEPQVVPVSEAEIPYLLWHKAEAKVNRGKLTLEVNKQPYTFHISPDYNGQTLVLRYEPEDLSEVYVFASDEAETHLCVLAQKLSTRRESIQESANQEATGRKGRKAEEDRALALVAPHMAPKEILSQEEEEIIDQLLNVSHAPANKAAGRELTIAQLAEKHSKQHHEPNPTLQVVGQL
ncbi:Mu transposase C-terminal domain-containing protein [Pontibacter flavimaris]|uniref:Integrase catalytic domain-containing protein n=1 Tax=Pontibacter flavimaris TaxID=1797110 RepID=A0A1Q5PDI1_9BACT|nr:Mu transposase C-terminal domain-containing protein [Pontibacter flavimaris]OKL40274.1 hypothetical protein A3841_18285 [Pontibacter flavimaris]